MQNAFRQGDVLKMNRWLPPHFFIAAILISVALDLLLPFPDFIESPIRWISVIPVVLGLWIATASSRHFASVGTAIRPFERSTFLVTDGWFRWSRNPMYVSMIMILIGIGILLGSVQAFLPAVLLGPVLYHRFIRREEVMLGERFGEDYENYRSRVRRWF